MATNSSGILHDFSPFIIVYNDGGVKRLSGEDRVPPGVDTDTGVESKDVIISSDPNVSVRLYLPKNAAVSGQKLPLLVYVHGGGFVIESAFSPTYHNHLNSLASVANVVIVSVEYRRAPETPLLAAYEDSWLALEWVAASNSNDESADSWLKDYADFNQVYFGGDSAGGNIVHHMALKVGSENLKGLNLIGLFLNCPFFWGKKPTDSEASNPKVKKLFDDMWPFVYPDTTGLDDPLLNPIMDPNLNALGCKRVLVFVGGDDLLKDRGWIYIEKLREIIWRGRINIVEFEGEGHVFNLYTPDTDNDEKMQKWLDDVQSMLRMMASFLNRED